MNGIITGREEINAALRLEGLRNMRSVGDRLLAALLQFGEAGSGVIEGEEVVELLALKAAAMEIAGQITARLGPMPPTSGRAN